MRLTVSREDLYAIKIEKLNLNDKTYNFLRRNGLIAIGDALEMCERFNPFTEGTVSVSSEILEISFDEIIIKIIEYLHDNHSEPSQLIDFDITIEKLYYVGIEKLNLTVKTYNRLQWLGITSIGDVIDVIFTILRPEQGVMIDPAPTSRFADDVFQEFTTKTVEYLHDYHAVWV